MSASPRPTEPVVVIVPSPERTAALTDLAAALTALGDDASRASQTTNDVRLHVVACQAEHLAGDVRDLLPDGAVDDRAPQMVGLGASVDAARHALRDREVQLLPESLAASLEWLLQLAETAAS